MMIAQCSNHRPSERGTVVVVALVFMAALVGLTGILFSLAHAATEQSTQRVTTLRLELAATSVADMVANRLWDGFLLEGGGDPGDLGAYKSYLASTNNMLGSPLVGSGEKGELYGDPVDASFLFFSGDESSPKFGRLGLEQVEIRRRDHPQLTELEITVVAETGDDSRAHRRTVRQVFTVGGEPFEGFDYALLSNNVNCIMCHAQIDNVERYYNTDSSRVGTFDRVRVGTLESLMIRASSAESIVAGSIYTRGLMMDRSGEILTSLSGTTLGSAEFDDYGKIREDSDGGLYETPFIPVDGDPLPPLGNLYLDYPTDSHAQSDGRLPDSFPPPIPDLDGDRLVDPEEFDALRLGADGTIGGGVIYEVEDSGTFTGGLPSSGNVSGIDGATASNLILLGTKDNPIDLSGSIAVDGDVVIAGYVKGEGQVFASGNVYILGDLQYADGVDVEGNRTFGVGVDGTRNALALAAGGNVIIGDYVSSKNGNIVTGDGTGDFNFTMTEITLFNRTEWSRTQSQLPDEAGTLVDNPLYDPNHKPRYYVMDQGDPVYVFNKGDVYFDPATASWKGREHVSWYDESRLSRFEAGDASYDQASIVSLAPSNSWLTPSTLKGFWNQVDSEHSGGPMAIDSLIYTNNSAWALVRKSSAYNGQMILNGGLVAADTGVLVPGQGDVGLQLNYDARLKDVLQIRENGGPAEMTRSLWMPVTNHRANGDAY